MIIGLVNTISNCASYSKQPHDLSDWCISGDSGDGSVVGRLFWTLPAPGAPLTISALHVVPGKTSLELRWRGLPCISSYMVRICRAECNHTLVHRLGLGLNHPCT